MNSLRCSPSKFLYFLIATITLTLTLTQLCHAQNSPQDYLDAHNLARVVVGVPALSWDDTLATYAQQFANLRKNDCDVTLDSGGPYGENRAVSTSALFSGTDAVALWLSGALDYDYTTNTCIGNTEKCLTYTQLVWSTTLSLGCDRVLCDNGGTFVICSYSPRGNILGVRPF